MASIYDNTGESNAYLDYLRSTYQIDRKSLEVPAAQSPAMSNAAPFGTTPKAKSNINPSVMQKVFQPSIVDTYKKAITQRNADLLNPPEIDDPSIKKGLGVTDYANIASGVLGIAQAASSIYGAKLADKMQPSIMSYQAPIEPELIQSNTEALKSAAKESIASQTATARASDRSGGIVDGGRNSVYLAKGMEAENQVAGQLAQMDMQLEAQNTQVKNQAKQFNAQMGMQSDQFNAQTKNQFDQWKSSVVGAGYSNALDGLQQATGAIINNENLKSTIAKADIKNEITDLQNQFDTLPTGKQKLEVYEKLKEARQKLYS